MLNTLSGMEEKVFQKLQAAQDDHHYKVYKKAAIPERLHYKHNVRVTPIVALADLGYQFISNMSDEDFKPGVYGLSYFISFYCFYFPLRFELLQRQSQVYWQPLHAANQFSGAVNWVILFII